MRFISQLRALSGGKPIGFKVASVDDPTRSPDFTPSPPLPRAAPPLTSYVRVCPLLEQLCVGQPHELAALVHAMVDSGVTPDFITVDGAEGGTGAAPLEFQNSVGFPLAEGLRLVDSMLVGAGVRDEITIIGSGKVYNGFSLVRTLAHGADLTNAARSFMFSLGCIQALKCNSNTCPTGITTQNPELESGLDVESKADRIRNFHRATVHAALEIVGAVGVSSPKDVTPRHLYRRESGFKAMDYAQLSKEYFPVLEEPGILLNEASSSGKVPKQLAYWWAEGGKLHAKTKHL